MKKIAIMQPYFLPYLGYWQLMHAVDNFILLDDVSYMKKGWINRNRILLNGHPFNFTLPILKTSQNKKIYEHNIADAARWKSKFIKTLEAAYSKSIYFDEVIKLVINPIMSITEMNTALYLKISILNLMNVLELTCDLKSSRDFENINNLTGQSRIIDICIKSSSYHYINLPGGKTIYSQKEFMKNFIKLEFLEPYLPRYNQINSTSFISSLSIIDVLFNCGICKTIKLVKNTTLK